MNATTTFGLHNGFPGISSMCLSATINCPGLGWDGDNFFTAAGRVLWIEHENNADNPPMFWFLLSCVYPKSRTFVCVCVPRSASEELHKRKLGVSIFGTGDLNWSK